MFTLFVLFVFAWLFVKSVGLAFHVTWGLAKFVATLLFVIALPLLVVFRRHRRAAASAAAPGSRGCRLLHSEKGIKYPTAVRPGAARRFLVIEVSAWYTCSQGVLRLLSSNKEVFPMKLVVCFPGSATTVISRCSTTAVSWRPAPGTTTPFAAIHLPQGRPARQPRRPARGI